MTGMHIALVSLFPEMFDAVTAHGVTGRAVRQGLVGITPPIDIVRWTTGPTAVARGC